MVFFNLELPAQQIHNLVFTENPLPAEVLAQFQTGLAVLDEGLRELLFGKKPASTSISPNFFFTAMAFATSSPSTGSG